MSSEQDLKPLRLLLSIIHLPPIERLSSQISLKEAKGPSSPVLPLIKQSQRGTQTPALKTINNATLTCGSRAIRDPAGR